MTAERTGPWPPSGDGETLTPSDWPVAVIGPGRVGSAVARSLARLGHEVVAVGGGAGESARRLAE